MVRSIIGITAFVIYIASFNLAHAQTWGQQFTVTKQGDRFAKNLNLYLSPEAEAFMKSADLKVEWWGLTGQPVYYYKFKWVIADSIEFSHPKDGKVLLSRSLLKKHPKLVKRFDDLRPTEIEISFDVQLNRDLQNKLFLNDEKDALSVETYFSYSKFKYSKTLRHVPHIMIGKSGKIGDNISPGSPKNYRAFIDKASDSKNYEEKKLSNTFKDTGAITFINPQITKLVLPEREMKAIWDAYKKREKEEEPEKIEDDFWDEDDSGTIANGAASGCDDFWEQNENCSNDQAKDDFWDGESGADGKEDFEISYRRLPDKHLMGVKNKRGKTLIPYKDWRIYSYRNGFAHAEEDVKVIEEKQCIHNFGWQNLGNGYFQSQTRGYQIIEMHSGLVGSNGLWLSEPKKLIYFTPISKDIRTSYERADTCNNRSWLHQKSDGVPILRAYEGKGYEIIYEHLNDHRKKLFDQAKWRSE